MQIVKFSLEMPLSNLKTRGRRSPHVKHLSTWCRASPYRDASSTPWKDRAQASAPRRATARATKPTRSPCPGQSLRHPPPAQEGKETVFTRAVTLSRQAAFLHLSRQAEQPARPGRWVFCSWTYSSSLHKHDIEKLQSVMYFFFPMGHARKTTPVQSSSSSHLATGAHIFVMAGKKINFLISIVMHKKQSCG